MISRRNQWLRLRSGRPSMRHIHRGFSPGAGRFCRFRARRFLVCEWRGCNERPTSGQGHRRCIVWRAVRTCIGLLAVIPVIGLTVACGGVTDAMPAGPSLVAAHPAALTPQPAQGFPSLTGWWRASGRMVFRNLENGNTLSRASCSGSLTITAQDGGTFTGSFGTQGGGWNSDRFCTASGTFVGELLAPDGSVARARLDGNFQNWPRPSVWPSCEFVSNGDGIWTGSATSDDIRLQTSDILRCPVNLDGGLAEIPMADFERTVSLTFQRW